MTRTVSAGTAEFSCKVLRQLHLREARYHTRSSVAGATRLDMCRSRYCPLPSVDGLTIAAFNTAADFIDGIIFLRRRGQQEDDAHIHGNWAARSG